MKRSGSSGFAADLQLTVNNERRLIFGLFDHAKDEERIALAGIDDISDPAGRLKATANSSIEPQPAKDLAPGWPYALGSDIKSAPHT
ncbi:MAG: hypothetical protein EON92_13735 [Burkholderiales bacterium]|nr:MAG: hypothetical protein EON92_13735 [Burkholderiales bacterium]